MKNILKITKAKENETVKQKKGNCKDAKVNIFVKCRRQECENQNGEFYRQQRKKRGRKRIVKLN